MDQNEKPIKHLSTLILHFIPCSLSVDLQQHPSIVGRHLRDLQDRLQNRLGVRDQIRRLRGAT
jgi:hypothetical protein